MSHDAQLAGDLTAAVFVARTEPIAAEDALLFPSAPAMRHVEERIG